MIIPNTEGETELIKIDKHRRTVDVIFGTALGILILLLFLHFAESAALEQFRAEARIETAAKFHLEKDALALNAQIEAANWAKYSVGVGFLSTAVSLAALIGLFRSLTQTRQAVDSSTIIGKAQTSAYVYVDQVTWGKSVPIVHCKNGGPTPATYFSIKSDVYKKTLGTITNTISFDRTLVGKAWSSLGPGSVLTAATPISSEKLLIDFAHGKFATDEALVLQGIITYGDVLGDTYETEFVFYAMRHGGKFLRPVGQVKAFYKVS